MPNKLNSNIIVLDSLRAFAALSVCLYHFVFTTQDFVSNQFILSVFFYGFAGVITFFVISGFIIPYAMHNSGFEFKNIITFLLKRLLRLEPPYLFSIIIAISILFIRKYYFGLPNAHQNLTPQQVLLHLGYLIPFFKSYNWLNEVYWTLAIEFQYYIFIALIFTLLVYKKLLIRIVCYLSILLVSFVSSDYFLPYWLPIFLLGILTFLFLAKYIERNEFNISFSLLVIFCLYRYPASYVIFAIIPVLSIIYFQNINIPVLHLIGKFSYSLYLTHSLVGSTFINILSHYSHNAISKVLIVVVGLLISLLGAYLVYIFIEKPSKKISTNIKYIH
jgi:peptidoglycan/LPS O-acetylase OafA/YrhL